MEDTTTPAPSLADLQKEFVESHVDWLRKTKAHVAARSKLDEIKKLQAEYADAGKAMDEAHERYKAAQRAISESVV